MAVPGGGVSVGGVVSARGVPDGGIICLQETCVKVFASEDKCLPGWGGVSARGVCPATPTLLTE